MHHAVRVRKKADVFLFLSPLASGVIGKIQAAGVARHQLPFGHPGLGTPATSIDIQYLQGVVSGIRYRCFPAIQPVCLNFPTVIAVLR